MLKIMISSCTLHSVKLCGYTFIAKQKMYRLWHSTWYIPPGHCLYYHRHYHLHQFTSVEDLLATTIANDQLYLVTTAFSNFLKRASTVLLLQWTFYQIRKAVISSRHNQLFCRCFCPFFHWHSSILTPQLRNRHVIFVTSFSSERTDPCNIPITKSGSELRSVSNIIFLLCSTVNDYSTTSAWLRFKRAVE